MAGQDGIKVYYNSACPVCKAGVEGQQCRMGGPDGEGVEWIDVHQHPELASETGADLEAVRERLHVRAADGSVLVGADAFAALFRRTAGQRWLARLVALPGVRALSRLLYNVFARGLYRWNRAKKHW